MSRKQVLPEYSDVFNLLKYILVCVCIYVCVCSYIYYILCIYILAFQQFGYSQSPFQPLPLLFAFCFTPGTELVKDL